MYRRIKIFYKITISTDAQGYKAMLYIFASLLNERK
jgi:hypothetical protein